MEKKKEHRFSNTDIKNPKKIEKYDVFAKNLKILETKKCFSNFCNLTEKSEEKKLISKPSKKIGKSWRCGKIHLVDESLLSDQTCRSGIFLTTTAMIVMMNATWGIKKNYSTFWLGNLKSKLFQKIRMFLCSKPSEAKDICMKLYVE